MCKAQKASCTVPLSTYTCEAQNTSCTVPLFTYVCEALLCQLYQLFSPPPLSTSHMCVTMLYQLHSNPTDLPVEPCSAAVQSSLFTYLCEAQLCCIQLCCTNPQFVLYVWPWSASSTGPSLPESVKPCFWL
jgi:hypothetical protein